MSTASMFRLIDALRAEEFPLPDEVMEVRFVLGDDGAMKIQYDVFVTTENLARLGRAMVRLAEEKQHVR